MKTREKIELALIPVVVVAVGLAGPLLPVRLGTGSLLTIGCLLWLVQGALRDLWLLYLQKTRAAGAPRRRLACMCLESSAGLAGVLLGVALILLGVGGEVFLAPAWWMLLTGGVLILGFLAKDLVITWRPLGLRRVPDHHTIIFTWW